MAIVEEDLERLRASLVLSDVVQQHLALRGPQADEAAVGRVA